MSTSFCTVTWRLFLLPLNLDQAVSFLDHYNVTLHDFRGQALKSFVAPTLVFGHPAQLPWKTAWASLLEVGRPHGGRPSCPDWPPVTALWVSPGSPRRKATRLSLTQVGRCHIEQWKIMNTTNFWGGLSLSKSSLIQIKSSAFISLKRKPEFVSGTCLATLEFELVASSGRSQACRLPV